MSGKIFIVSHNKCGTTSLKAFFRENGFRVGRQKVAEALHYRELLDSGSTVGKSDWVNYIESAQVFQDVPFSTAGFLPWLVRNYSDALFIHVSRDSESWYQSLIFHHVKRRLGMEPYFDNLGSLLWSNELEVASTARPHGGYALHKIIMARYGTPPDSPYRKSTLTAQHQFQQTQANDLLRDRRSLMLDLDSLGRGETNETFAKVLRLDEMFPIPHRNKK
jgi:hypothetical protein